ncbi:MAG: hypothetical protein K2K46_14190 [Lachnospiraceae bacterium]|nr:hypothetical protein [Lachnospiraceae bacterium]
MKYANQISEIINAFSPEPLNLEQMKEFYCSNTMEYRMSDKYSSPMEDIFDSCCEEGVHNSFLLLGHRGCGKSTELNRMSAKLEKNGCKVKNVFCSLDLDMQNTTYYDLFILMGEALLKIAEECKCDIGENILKDILNFWSEGIEVKIDQNFKNISLETGLSADTAGIFGKMFSLFTNMKADLRLNEERRKEYRQKISTHSTEWIRLLGAVSEEISKKIGGKLPIIIFEDLDKLNPDSAWNIFYNYAAVLSGMPFSVIYTFPIALSYDTKFSAMESYFTIKTLPMIKIETIEGQTFKDGIDIILKLIEKRADRDLFEAEVLEKLIQYTGGSLRDLFHTINLSAKRAERRKSAAISMEDAERALEELKTSLTRRIEKRDYEFLKNIYEGNKELIEDKEMLLKMLQASVVLEYNGKRWHNVHPLVVRFLKEQGVIEDVGK